MEENTIICGDNLEAMRAMPDNSIDSVICDPPYEISFMSKGWDSNGIAFSVELWQEVLRIAKPGAIMLVFGGTRTSHRLACAIEDAGWLIRDKIFWCFGSGFPKSLQIALQFEQRLCERRNGKWYYKSTDEEMLRKSPFKHPQANEWAGYGTSLKPAYEDIYVAMKPLDGTFAQNAEKWGVAGLNIDGGRIGIKAGDRENYGRDKELPHANTTNSLGKFKRVAPYKRPSQGRWPADLILGCACENEHEPDCPVAMLDEQSQGASRFFYTAKESKRNRNLGLDSWCTVKYNIPNDVLRKDILCKDISTVAVQLLKKVTSDMATMSFNTGESGGSITALCQWDSLSTILTETNKIIESKILHLLTYSLINESIAGANFGTENGGSPAESVASLLKWIQDITSGNLELARGASLVASEMLLKISVKENWQQLTNFHPTVKSIKLMEYLCNLTKTPTGGLVLDPFGGSGTTAVACVNTGRKYILIEKEAEYVEIIKRRAAYAVKQRQGEGGLFG